MGVLPDFPWQTGKEYKKILIFFWKKEKNPVFYKNMVDFVVDNCYNFN